MGEKEAKKREAAMFQKNSILLNKIDKLEATIKKMRCCGNCSHDYDEEGFVIPKECNTCINLSNWELKEIE